MNRHLENVLERPANQKILGLLGLLVTITFIYWWMFFKPVGEELSTLRGAIDGPNGLHVQIAAEEGIAKDLDKFVVEVKRLDVELEKALRQLPNAKEIDALLTQVSNLARDAGLEIRLFKPQPERKKDYYADVPVEMEVSGTYHQIATFFDEVGHLDRIMNLDEFSMVDPKIGEENVLLKTAVIGTTFRFLDESERALEDKKKKGRGRKRPTSDHEDEV